MKFSLSLAGAALIAGLSLAAPASAQLGSVTGVGPARTANAPSAVGLGYVEGRSGWHRHRGWHRGWGWRHRGWHRGWRHHRHWR